MTVRFFGGSLHGQEVEWPGGTHTVHATTWEPHHYNFHHYRLHAITPGCFVAIHQGGRRCCERVRPNLEPTP